MELSLRDTLLVSKESVLNKEHNLWVAWSHGNKWFTHENLSSLIKFGLKYTKDSFLIVIPSRLYATNFKYIENKGRAESLREAFELGDKRILEVNEIKSGLSPDEQGKIIIATYDETITLEFLRKRELLMREFSKQERFYDLVIEIAKDVLAVRGRTISKDRAENSALYVLQEIPWFLDGVMKINTSILHTVILYPGLGKLDTLVQKMKESPEFEELRKKLNLINKTGIADVR